MTCLVWVYFYFIHHCCKDNTSLWVAGIHCDWYLCLYLTFIDLFKGPFTVATELGKYLLTSFDVNPGHDWNIHCLLPLSMLMEQGLNLHHVGTVSVLGVMKFDVNYYFILFVSALVITLVVQRVVFYIIHCFYIVFPGWLFCPCIWFSLLVIWT